MEPNDIKILHIRGYRGHHRRCADHPDEVAGACWHENCVGQIRIDTDHPDIQDVYIPAADLIEFANLYQKVGRDAIARWTVGEV